ncbi:iron complex transport system substrate-binding protein [Pullulanibacillus pueri]|uniref:Ferrichrome ABC transporter substrate-binding protein n=1 Tax=Pullulanibacillus pueri TaxID=1437324 RepID=A0A8J3EMM7_9BACL|nr:ABC transporter substrate-binding protein [Pullulanibacillus pueri]MBM7680906.1 iron complex transport system substrate-binding protein [Pullulanibacillus pueri]GGH81282.1 ferrichrome ABC transporter substrate-binding protein [Pullulanibacillus pueri]
MTYRKKTIKIMQLCGIALLSIGLVACGSQDQSSKSKESKSSAEQSSTTREVTDAMGHKLKVPTKPKRVLASYLEDYLVALDVKPVAQWSVANGIQDYLQDDGLKGVPTISYDLPFEAVQKVKPDLIIMDSADMVEGGKYDQYNKIAPTYVVGKEKNNDWRKELLAVGKVLNKEDQAKKVLADYEKKAKAAKEKLQQDGKSPSVAAVWLTGGKFFMVSKNLSSGDVLYNDLGLKVPKVVDEISAKATSNWNPISLEKLTELDADYLFFINSDKKDASVLQQPLWKNIPAVKNNHVTELPASSSWLYTGTIANTEIIDDVLNSIDK